MPEDPLILREESAQLKKDIAQSNHVKDALNKHVEELHQEELRYISEIPAYKKQAKEAEYMAGEASGRLTASQKLLEDAQKELIKVQGLTIKENKALSELKDTYKRIIKETSEINLQIDARHSELKDRERINKYQIDKINSLELINNNKQNELDKREINIKKNEDYIKSRFDDLKLKQDYHSKKVDEHEEKVDALIQSKELHLQDEQTLRDKLQKSEKIIQDNLKLKSDLLLQSEKLSKEIIITQNKQVSLDRSLADLVNQENTLKIKELKVNKLIRDKGLQDELRALQESLK